MMFGVDTTPLPRPDAEYADGRTTVHRRDGGGDAFLPGYTYSLVVGVGWGASSWVDPVDARRVAPGDNPTDLTVAQVRDVLADLAATGRLAPGDPDRWVQLAMAAYTQLKLARTLTGDLRRPWHRKLTPGATLTPYRTRLGFRPLRARLGSPAHGPKSTRPGPGRPKGSKNRPKARRPVHRKTPAPDTTH